MYPKDISEFDVTGLSKEYKRGFKAHSVKERTVQLAVEFKESIALFINNTIMVIGAVTQLYFPNDCYMKTVIWILKEQEHFPVLISTVIILENGYKD